MMNKDKINRIFSILQKENPNPKSELHYHSPFELLIAVILSAQATDKSVNLVTDQLFRIANTPKKILGLGENALKQHIKSIGLYNTKAKNIIKTCKILIEQHHSKIPDTRNALEKLPGVGRKTANIVLNIAFNEPTIAVDTHVFRVSNRTKIAPGKDVLTVEKKLIKIVPDEFKQQAHYWLILLGRYICVARKPKCPICPIRHLCEYPNKFNIH